MKKLLLLVMLLTSTAAWGSDKERWYTTADNPSCGDYVTDRKQHSAEWAKWWIAGYITAYNRQTPNTVNILGNTDLDGVHLWMENWCKANPLKGAAGGMKVLTDELYPKRHKTRKEAGH